MLTTLIVCLCLWTDVHADVENNGLDVLTWLSRFYDNENLFPSDTTTPPPLPAGVKEELDKIAATCLNKQDYELLTGNALKWSLAYANSVYFIGRSVEIIGLEELRKVLGVPPPGPWKKYNYANPSCAQLASAATVTEYYELREPRDERRSLDSNQLFEHNIITAIGYLDKRVPSIRTVFKKVFEDILPSPLKVLDYQKIEELIGVYEKTLAKVDKAKKTMIDRDECLFRKN